MKKPIAAISLSLALVGLCLTASSNATARTVYAPSKASVTNVQPVNLPSQWTVTTAITATTSFFTATPATATVTTTSTIATGTAANPSGSESPDFDSIQ